MVVPDFTGSAGKEECGDKAKACYDWNNRNECQAEGLIFRDERRDQNRADNGCTKRRSPRFETLRDKPEISPWSLSRARLHDVDRGCQHNANSAPINRRPGMKLRMLEVHLLQQQEEHPGEGNDEACADEGSSEISFREPSRDAR